MSQSNLGELLLKATLHEFSRYKTLSEGALAQVSDQEWFYVPNAQTNCIAIIVKHMPGNLRWRWQDFLSSDGEKPDRKRDNEFELYPSDTVSNLGKRWQESWEITLETLESLESQDFSRTITIRGEPLSVVDAIQRSLAHTAHHVGQIVLLAKLVRGSAFKSLSIPKGQSEQFFQAMRARHAKE